MDKRILKGDGSLPKGDRLPVVTRQTCFKDGGSDLDDLTRRVCARTPGLDAWKAACSSNAAL